MIKNSWALIAFLLSIFTTGCASQLPTLPKWPTTAIKVPRPAPQKKSPCEGSKSAPKSVKLSHGGHDGYWISRRRVLCLLARSRVARTCRGACEKRIAHIKRAHDHVMNTVLAVAKRRELVAKKRQKKKRIISFAKGLSAGLVVAALSISLVVLFFKISGS